MPTEPVVNNDHTPPGYFKHGHRYDLITRNVIPSEVSADFVQGMADRMAFSFYKYGPVRESTSDHIASLEKRLKLYKEDGNLEWLMDAANFAMSAGETADGLSGSLVRERPDGD
jgi:hypothetical protein